MKHFKNKKYTQGESADLRQGSLVHTCCDVRENNNTNLAQVDFFLHYHLLPLAYSSTDITEKELA